MVNIDVEKVLETEMDRKQFLKNVGIGIVALTGVTAALKAFSQVPVQGRPRAQQISAAYGGSVYGGAAASPVVVKN